MGVEQGITGFTRVGFHEIVFSALHGIPERLGKGVVR
jgi:hypothetical protein